MADHQGTTSNSTKGPAGGVDGSPPSYVEDAAPGPSSRPSAAPSQQPEGPTLKDPFNFPPSADLPSYSEASPLDKPIAIPQSRPDPTAPFIAAHAPALLARGVMRETWHPFLATVSAFLTAKASAKAIAHTGDMARHLGATPASYGKRVARNAQTVRRHIADSATRRDVFGVVVGVVGGGLSLTVGTVFGAVGAALAMPGTALDAVTRRPRTSRERAAAYVTVANRSWLNARGLDAVILDTLQLCRAVGLADSRQLLEEASGQGLVGKKESEGAAGQLQRLERYFCEVQTEDDEALQLGATTLWLVVNQLPR